MVIHFNELLHRFPRHLKVLPTAIVQDSTRLIILWCRLQSLKQFMSSMLSIRKFMLRLQVVNKTYYKHIACTGVKIDETSYTSISFPLPWSKLKGRVLTHVSFLVSCHLSFLWLKQVSCFHEYYPMLNVTRN